MTTLATFQNVSIRNGVTTSGAVAIPDGLNYMDVSMTRNNWPAAGVTIELLASFDGGTTYETVAGPQMIADFVATPKQPTVTDAQIGFSWGADRIPTHAKGRATSTSKAFTSTISIIGG